jgi:hypothetical protein
MTLRHHLWLDRDRDRDHRFATPVLAVPLVDRLISSILLLFLPFRTPLLATMRRLLFLFLLFLLLRSHLRLHNSRLRSRSPCQRRADISTRAFSREAATRHRHSRTIVLDFSRILLLLFLTLLSLGRPHTPVVLVVVVVAVVRLRTPRSRAFSKLFRQQRGNSRLVLAAVLTVTPRRRQRRRKPTNDLIYVVTSFVVSSLFLPLSLESGT